MKSIQRVRRLMAASSFAVASLAFAAYAPGSQAAGQALPGSVLFSQTHVDSYDSPDATALFQAHAAGGPVSTLAPLTVGTLNLGARWSTHGHAIVFERVSTADWFTQSEIYRMDSDGKHLRQITVGKSRHQYPVWGPGGWIAYIDGGVDSNQCLALIRPNGDEQHILFCPGPTDAAMLAPQWSPDGSKLFIEAHYYGNVGLNPPAYSDIYKVDVRTGRATRLSHLNVGDVEADLSISPDGTRAAYAWYTSAMEIVDFATGKTVEGLTGASPRWSHDGRQLAFTKEINMPGSSYATFGAVFVMCADGTHVRQLTNRPVANEYYSPVDWSKDDAHLLLNREHDVIQGSNAYQYLSVHVLDVATRAITTVTNNGTADTGAWQQP